MGANAQCSHKSYPRAPWMASNNRHRKHAKDNDRSASRKMKSTSTRSQSPCLDTPTQPATASPPTHEIKVVQTIYSNTTSHFSTRQNKKIASCCEASNGYPPNHAGALVLKTLPSIHPFATTAFIKPFFSFAHHTLGLTFEPFVG